MTGLGAPQRWQALAVALWLTLGGLAPSAAGQDQLDEYQVKAAFLYNFVKFIPWPPGRDAITVGIVGDSAVEPPLQRLLKGRLVAGRSLVVRQALGHENLATFDVLFISAAEARRTAEFIRRAGTGYVLTVGETAPFLRDGGMVRFFVESSRVRFQINVPAAEKSGFKIPSQLLSLATR